MRSPPRPRQQDHVAKGRRPAGRALDRNRRTLHAYERSVDGYVRLVSDMPPPPVARALRRLAAAIPRGGSVLEIGSGPGRDADFLEGLGCHVRRTDATKAFIDHQARRGRQVDFLNVLTDPLGGPYNAVLAMFVLIHIDRAWIEGVLAKIAGALRPGGAMLLALWEGDGDTAGRFHTVYWRRPAFRTRLADVGLAVTWQAGYVDEDGDRAFTMLARPSSATSSGVARTATRAPRARRGSE